MIVQILFGDKRYIAKAAWNIDFGPNLLAFRIVDVQAKSGYGWLMLTF